MKQQLATIISQHVEGLSAEEILPLLETPPKPELGDYAFPCFRLAKIMHKAPNLIAEDLKTAIGTSLDFVEEIKVQGAYCNFYIKKDYFVKTQHRTLWCF